MRSVSSLAKKLAAPPVPAGTMAALASTVPSNEFSVEATGCACPAGQAVTHLSGPCGTTVTLSEYAAAPGGAPHGLDGTGKERVLPPVMNGPPKGPLVFRVSRTRQGG